MWEDFQCLLPNGAQNRSEPGEGEDKKKNLLQLAIICSVVTLLRITTPPRPSDGRSI
jgi:hypothetical protein